MNNKNLIEQFSETLLIEDFNKACEKLNCKYITDFTIYTEDGLELKVNIAKRKNKKYQSLLKLWNLPSKKVEKST